MWRFNVELYPFLDRMLQTQRQELQDVNFIFVNASARLLPHRQAHGAHGTHLHAKTSQRTAHLKNITQRSSPEETIWSSQSLGIPEKLEDESWEGKGRRKVWWKSGVWGIGRYQWCWCWRPRYGGDVPRIGPWQKSLWPGRGRAIEFLILFL